MSINATFVNGTTTVTAKGLYQWDYGQKLQIVSGDLPALVEVHFACSGMAEAIVVPCSVFNGVGTVTIPDQCLEQTSPVTAWVYEYESERDAETGETVKTAGSTTKTITIPITSRARPNRSEDIPQTILDKYAELIAEVNKTVGALMSGDVMVANAVKADEASFATSAGNAEYASSAGSSRSASTAGIADTAHGLIGKVCSLVDGTYTLPDMNYRGLYIGRIAPEVGGLSSMLFIANADDRDCFGTQSGAATSSQYITYVESQRKIMWHDGSNQGIKLEELQFIPVTFPMG